MTSWAMSGATRSCAGRRRGGSGGVDRAIPRANTPPSAPMTSTVAPSSKSPSTSRRRQAAATSPARRAPCRAPSSTRRRPRPGWRRRSTASGPANGGRVGGTWCRHGGPSMASASTSGRVAWAITARTPRPRRDPRRGAAWRPSPAAAVGAGAAGADVEQRVVRGDLRDERRRRVRRGSAVYRPGVSVSSTSRSAVIRCGDERGDAVVVAEAELVAGDRVVLVDDRDAAELEQTGQRAAGVQVLAAVDEVVRHEQHLPGDEAVLGEAARCSAPSAAAARARRAPAACRRRRAGGRSRARRRRLTPRRT